MTQKLIFIGGAPGIGKTVTGEELLKILPDSIRVDGDALWCHMNPWRVDATTKDMVERNVCCVLTNFLRAGFSFVILCWVLHDQELIDRIVSGLGESQFEFHSVTLVCDETALRRRWESDSLRGSITDLAVKRLADTRSLTGRQIDTTELTVEEAAHAVRKAVTDD